MKSTIKLWKDNGYKIVYQDIKGGQYEGFIYDFDDIGIAILSCKKDDKSINVFPWTSILKIVRC